MYKYEIIIYWSKEDKAFIAEVPEASRVHGAWRHTGKGVEECKRRHSIVD